MEFITQHPGTYLREICRELALAMGVGQYHVYRLERDRSIVSRRRGLYKRFYPNLVFAETDQNILDVLSQETEREILIFLTQRPGPTQKEIADFARLSLTAVSWHMRRLVASGLIEPRIGGDSRLRYFVLVDKGLILKLLKSYHPAIWERWAERLADVWVDLSDIGLSLEARRHDFEY